MLRLLLPLLIAVLFAAAGPVRAMPSGAAEPPCHMTGMAAGHQAPAKHAPATDMMAMSCCVACLTTPAQSVTLAAPVRRAAQTPAPAVLPTPIGRTPAPEPEPPRPVA